MTAARRGEEDDAHRRAAHRKAKREAEDPEPHACEQCGRAAHGRFCYWCGKCRGLW